MSIMKLLDESLRLAAQVHELKTPPFETSVCPIRECEGCEYAPYCSACCEVKMNLIIASEDNNEQYDLANDINKVFTLAKAGKFKTSQEIGG